VTGEHSDKKRFGTMKPPTTARDSFSSLQGSSLFKTNQEMQHKRQRSDAQEKSGREFLQDAHEYRGVIDELKSVLSRGKSNQSSASKLHQTAS
jgi:hypothetical protein